MPEIQTRFLNKVKVLQTYNNEKSTDLNKIVRNKATLHRQRIHRSIPDKRIR